MPNSTENTENNTHNTAKNYDYYEDPLFLSTSDQPLLQIVSTAFDGNHFLTWKNDVVMALAAKNKDCFIEGTLPKPATTDRTYHQWIRCDLTVMKWIKHSLSKDIRDNVSYVKSSRELWLELLERYGQPNALEIYQIRKELVAISQANDSLVEFYSKLKRGWEKLDSFDPMPQCSCGALDLCTCQLLKKMLDRENQAKLIQFLMGLNQNYESVKTNILSTEPLPPLNKALGLLQRVERQKQITDAVDVLSEATAYASHRQSEDAHSGLKKQRTHYQSDNRWDKQCSHCHIKGHTKEECYRLKECNNCGKIGHIRDQCFRLRGSNFRNLRGRGRNSTARYQGGNNVYKRGAHNVDVVDYDATSYDTSPLDEGFFDNGDIHGVNDNQNGKQIMVNKEFVTGLVNTVMDKMMHAMSDKTSTLSSSNFAGPFK